MTILWCDSQPVFDLNLKEVYYMAIKHLESGLWKITFHCKNYLERWIKKHGFERYQNIIHKHGLYYIYIGKSNLGSEANGGGS